MMVKRILKNIFPLPANKARLAEKRILAEISALRNDIQSLTHTSHTKSQKITI